jgi:hypothetical protein
MNIRLSVQSMVAGLADRWNLKDRGHWHPRRWSPDTLHPLRGTKIHPRVHGSGRRRLIARANINPRVRPYPPSEARLPAEALPSAEALLSSETHLSADENSSGGPADAVISSPSTAW